MYKLYVYFFGNNNLKGGVFLLKNFVKYNLYEWFLGNKMFGGELIELVFLVSFKYCCDMVELRKCFCFYFWYFMFYIW